MAQLVKFFLTEAIGPFTQCSQLQGISSYDIGIILESVTVNNIRNWKYILTQKKKKK